MTATILTEQKGREESLLRITARSKIYGEKGKWRSHAGVHDDGHALIDDGTGAVAVLLCRVDLDACMATNVQAHDPSFPAFLDEALSLLAPANADARNSSAVTTIGLLGLNAIGSDTSTTALGIVRDVDALEPADARVVEALLVTAETVLGTLGLGLARRLEAGGLGAGVGVLLNAGLGRLGPSFGDCSLAIAGLGASCG